jgi:hypothetical protein
VGRTDFLDVVPFRKRKCNFWNRHCGWFGV